MIAQSFHSDISVADSVVFIYYSDELGSTYRFAPWGHVGQYRYHLFVDNHIVRDAYQSQDSYGVLADSFIVYDSAAVIAMQSVLIIMLPILMIRFIMPISGLTVL